MDFTESLIGKMLFQPAIACSELTIETREQDVKNIRSLQ